MQNFPSEIRNLGFSQWYQDAAGSDKLAAFDVARVISVHKDSYTLTDGQRNFPAELIGKLIFSADSPEDYPTVGDWVLGQFYNEGSVAVIHEIVPRKSLLKRKTSGKNVDFQLIAANVDAALLMQSMDANYNLRRLERYLVMIYENNIQPIVLLSKSDLNTPEEISTKVADILSAMPGIIIQPFSNKSKSGLETVKRLLASGQTYCLLGSSGVGKTTLINNLLGGSFLDTQSVRKTDSKGRHTTTRRDLIRLSSGAMIIDNPGMREFGVLAVETGLREAFFEIAGLAEQCRFKNCTHVNEDGCAVLNALETGALSEKRYRNFVKMSRESAYNDMSYLEKRKKDKAFGKMVKGVMRQKKNRR